MTTPSHHPGEELLLDYADGSLSEPAALAVATHLALCPECRLQVAALEAVGGLLLEETAPVPVSVDCLSRLMARLEETGGAPPTHRSPAEAILIPQPLRGYLGMPVAQIPWQPVLPGLDEYCLAIDARPIKTRLIRLRAEAAAPRHTHDGAEITLVLDGGFHDEFGHYRRGDMTIYGPEIEHRPTAEAGPDCLCLTVTEAPLRLTGPIGRWLNALVRY